MCLSDVCTTIQILVNFHKTDKNKKGARLTESKLYGILMRKIFFHDVKMIPKLSFFEHVPFLRQYVFFPSHEPKTYNFQVRSLHSAFKEVSFFRAELSFAYFLMLITMTCSTWLFIAVVIGQGLGFYLVSPLIKSYVGSTETDDCIDISINLLTTRHEQL